MNGFTVAPVIAIASLMLGIATDRRYVIRTSMADIVRFCLSVGVLWYDLFFFISEKYVSLAGMKQNGVLARMAIITKSLAN